MNLSGLMDEAEGGGSGTGLPTGGGIYMVLTKASGADFDVIWSDALQIASFESTSGAIVGGPIEVYGDGYFYASLDVSGSLTVGGVAVSLVTHSHAWSSLTGKPVRPITIGFDGGGAALTVGTIRYTYVPYACTIDAVVVDAQNETGSIVLDLWVDTLANFPPTSGDTITASAKPTLSAAKVSRDATLTGWSKTIAGGSYIACRIDSVSGLTKAVLTLEVSL